VGFWDQLNTFKISSNPGTQIQKQSDPIHLEEDNEDLLKSVKLVNDATLRSDGGIIPGTIALKVADFTDNEDHTVVTPAAGEVWRILMPVAKVTSGSVVTTPTYQLWIKDTATSVQYRVFYFSSTSSSPILNEDLAWDGEAYVLGEGQTLIASMGSFSATNIKFGVLAGRVR
tara:strand:- start:297 stop:812 length:516 start_codon:yes stop_codon:yes gene_type:complete